MIRFQCPSCRVAIQAPEERKGVKRPCPRCRTPLQVPDLPRPTPPRAAKPRAMPSGCLLIGLAAILVGTVLVGSVVLVAGILFFYASVSPEPMAITPEPAAAARSVSGTVAIESAPITGQPTPEEPLRQDRPPVVPEQPAAAVPGDVAVFPGQSLKAAEKPYLVLSTGGHSDVVARIAFTPDGKYLVSASPDRTLRVWDLSAGETVQTFRPPVGPGYEGELQALAVAPDGKTAAVGGWTLGEDKKSRTYLVALSSGRVEKVFPGHAATVSALAFSRDGRLLSVGYWDGIIRVHDTATGKEVRTFTGPRLGVHYLAFSADGRRLASTTRGGTATIWSMAVGTPDKPLRDGNRVTLSLDWSPDGKTIAVGNSDGTVSLWDADGKLRSTATTLRHQVTCLAFSADSRELLYTVARNNPADTRPQGCGIIDPATGNERLRCPIYSGSVFAGALAHGGKLAATTAGSEILVWNTADGSLAARLAGKGRAVWGVGWSPDGKSIGWGNLNRLQPGGAPLQRTFHLEDLQLGGAPAQAFHRARLMHGDRDLRLMPDGKLAIVNRTRRTTADFSPPPGDRVHCATFLPDGKVVLGTAQRLLLINADSDKPVRFFHGHSGQVVAIAVSPDGRYFATGASDQTIRIWDPRREHPVLSLYVADQDWVAWTEEGVYAASAAGEQRMGWQVNNGPDAAATFHRAGQFRKSLYHPDVVRRVLASGDTAQAFARAGKKGGEAIRVSQVLPPAVTITSPAGLGNVPVNRNRFEVQARAQSAGSQPVIALRLLVDGRPYHGAAGVRRVSNPALGEVRASWVVDVSPGLHQLSVVAESAVSRSLSPTVEVTVAGGSPGDYLPSLYIVAAGVDAYPAGMELHFAVADADAIAEAFRKQTGRAFRKVEVKLLRNREASKQGIEQGLAWLRGKMTPQDVGIFSFSGHGFRDNAGTFYLVPADVDRKNLAGSCVSGDCLKRALGEMPGRLIAVLDACHSGAATGGPAQSNQPGADDLVRDLITEDYGVIVLSSSLGREYSLESPQVKHGFFTLALLEALEGQGDLNKDGVVHINEIDLYSIGRVRALSRGMQNPVMAKPANVRSFPLARK